MSTDLGIRPVGAPGSAPVIQPSSQAVSNATPTVLAPSQSVTAADTSSSAGNDQGSSGNFGNAGNDVYIAHQAYFDRSAGTLVFQVVNSRTDEVVDQYPDEAVLRRRAYFHALDQQKSDVPHVVATDRTA